MSYQDWLKRNNVPLYPERTDYTTNAPSYYADLGRKNHLIILLAEKIWGYEEKLDITLEELESRLETYISENDSVMTERLNDWDERLEKFPENVELLLEDWLSDGTLDHIINDTIFNWKVDQTEFDEFVENTNSQLAQIDVKTKGIINVKEYGAVGDGVTDDTHAIQSAIDSIPQGNNMVTANGEVYAVVIPEGRYIVSDTIHFNKHAGQLIGLGNAVLVASEDFDSNSLTGILALGSDDGNYKNQRIKNITFTKKGANPYYDNIDYGGNVGWEKSTLGLLVDHTHYYVIEDCNFIGLRMGTLFKGAYAGQVVNSNYQFNDRHLQMVSLPSRGNNHVKISGTIFGHSFMNGGIVVIDANLITFDFCDIEGSSHTAVLTKSSKQIKFRECYFESNSRETNHVNHSPHVYDSTIYHTGVTDGLNSSHDGYSIVDDGGQTSYIIEDCLFAIPPQGSKGHMKTMNTRSSVMVRDSQLRMDGNTSIDYMFTTGTASPNPYHFYNCDVDSTWKLTNVVGSIVEQDKNHSFKGDRYTQDVFYVDLTAGDDYQRNDSVAEDSPIRDLQGLLMGIPKNYEGIITIHVTGTKTTRTLLDLRLTGGGSFTIKDNGATLGELPILFPKNGVVTFDGLTVNGSLSDNIVGSYNYRGENYGGGTLRIINSTIEANSTAGALFFNQQGNRTVFIEDSTVQQTGTGNNIIVQNGTEMWLNSVIINKSVSVRNGGVCYYRDINNGEVQPQLYDGALGIIQGV